MSYTVTVRYEGGAERRMPVAPEQTLLEAAEVHGVPIVSECESGVCGTCVAGCTSGLYETGRTEGLSQVEREQRKLLTCQATVQSDCVIELKYPLNDNAAQLVTGEAVVTAVELISASTALLRIDASSLGERLDYRAGQFAQLRVPGAEQWRSYSYAHTSRDDQQLEFIVRLLPQGVMSDYLRQRAKPGDRIGLRGSKGTFHLRAVTRPLVLVAGGTGLSAILAMAEQLAAAPLEHPVSLLYGVTHYDDLCKREVLEALLRRQPLLSARTIVATADARWDGPVGVVTDLLDRSLLNDGNADVYLCGPPAMVEAVRGWIAAQGLHRAGLYFEKFVPSGARQRLRQPPRVDLASLDMTALRAAARGTAVIVGGSVAGIATAKVLSERFDRVIVLEQDSQHDRREGRPGAAQGHHLHHLLIAGQQEAERIFPGIVDDMVREGAFKVDMARNYQLRLAGSWKKRCDSDIEIVCAGRPLIEWCLRRRLDDVSNIDFRYETEMQDLVYDAQHNAVIGVAVNGDDGLEVIPAEFVVDASGKNTRLPEFLERVGVGAPELEEDILNCFYSSMLHHVPPERRWDDKVMVICYAYRPHEQTYAAQYYIDQSRTILLTSLIEYNCYTPPRNPAEFAQFAKRMQSPVVFENIEGLEPASQVYNFRSPRMQRYRYEHLARPPAGLVAIGDAYTSTDPVAGLGMTITLQEVARLRDLLDKYRPADPALPRRYYRAVKKIADGAWFVVREQTLRFNWVRDVESKRPFYFRALNWYMDRLTELVHDDLDAYRTFLSVIHMVKPPLAMLTPSMVARVLGKWAATRLRGERTLIQRNYRTPPALAPANAPVVSHD